MIIRDFRESDIPALRAIHEQYYKGEFPLTEFDTGNYIYMFTVVDDDGKVITAGGVRTLAEVVIVTDKSLSAKVRREALIKTLQASLFIAKGVGINSLHAFVHDEQWMKQLCKHGFQPTAGLPLVTTL